jgi:putative Holliday junction resolvase
MPSQATLAIDVGRSRVGVAYCARDSALALPVATFERTNCEDFISALHTALLELSVDLHDVGCIYVGLPLSLSGTKTTSTYDAIDFANQLSNSTASEVRLIDERFSTTLANRTLRENQRSQKESRGFVDQMAAIEILNHANAITSRTGSPAGSKIDDWIE